MDFEVFPYHKNVKEYFKNQVKTWEFFEKIQQNKEEFEKFKLELLQNAYRFPKDHQLYQLLSKVLEKISINQEITFYQAQYLPNSNASVAISPDEAHIVFSGDILKQLNDEELLATIAHEIGHLYLLSIEDKEYEIAERIITTIANDFRAEIEYVNTARKFNLFTELFCDRISYKVTGNIDSVISALVKITTRLEEVSVASYIKQAEEILTKDVKSKGISHPEVFIRTRAIDLFSRKEDDFESKIINLIEDLIDIDKLDLFEQSLIYELSLSIVERFIKPNWIQSDTILALARQYHPDIKKYVQSKSSEYFLSNIQKFTDSTKDYLSYILIDFIKADKDLEDAPLYYAYIFSQEIGIVQSFEKTYKKEFKLSDKAFQDLIKKSKTVFEKVYGEQ